MTPLYKTVPLKQTCFMCGKQFEALPYQRTEKAKHPDKKMFCSTLCARKHQQQVYKCLTGYNSPFDLPKVRKLVSERQTHRNTATKHMPQSALDLLSNEQALVEWHKKNAGSPPEGVSVNAYYTALRRICPEQIQRGSHFQEEVRRAIGGVPLQNVRITPQYEIDLLYGDVGIEVNGSYWHDFPQKAKDYHFKKALAAREQGIRLIYITERCWKAQKDTILNIIFTALHSDKIRTIQAEFCTVVMPTREELTKFEDTYNINGSQEAEYSFGLLYDNELVLTLSISRNLQYSSYEIIRETHSQGILVVEGLAKLLSAATAQLSITTLIACIDFNYFDGKELELLGFKFTKFIPPTLSQILSTKVLATGGFVSPKIQETTLTGYYGAGSLIYIKNTKIR